MKVISLSSLMISLLVYFINCLYYELLKYEDNYYPFSFLDSASADTVSPAVYLSSFIMAE